MNRLLSGLLLAALLAASAGGCSTGRLVARATTPVLGGSLVAMHRETDLALAEAATPASLKLLEGLIIEDPGNRPLREYAAQGFYGYAFGFVEDQAPARASTLYRRCLEHAAVGLHLAGLREDLMTGSEADLSRALAGLGASAVPSLFWAGSCWAKWIDMNRNDPARLAELGRAAALMERVRELDEKYYYGGADLFLGVYYGSRPPMLGGDYAKAEQYFDRARTLSGGAAYLVDVLYAQYLDRQKQDQADFHRRLTGVLQRPLDRHPDLALENAIAQRKARDLLAREQEWF